MAGREGPNWEGLLKWTLAHSDGTGTTRNLSEEDRKWFMEAMQSQSVDVVKRMKEITLVMQAPEDVLASQGVTTEDIEGMLDELQEHVESIDMANDLHAVGGLVPLLNYLKSTHASIRAKAAEVVSTIVQNNPRSQQLVMEEKGMEPLLSNFMLDHDVTVRIKSLGAISSLIRHNKAGIITFRLANGYVGLRDALSSHNVRLQRRSLNLIYYLLQENSSDCIIVKELGLPRVLLHLASNEDCDVREAALRCLLEFTRQRKDSSNSSYDEDDNKLRATLEERIKCIRNISAEDLNAAREEMQLLDSLWTTCFDEPSSLRNDGLLHLPIEDTSPPDVSSKLFAPALRALSESFPPDKLSDGNKQSTPLLLGSGLPPVMTTTMSYPSDDVQAEHHSDGYR